MEEHDAPPMPPGLSLAVLESFDVPALIAQIKGHERFGRSLVSDLEVLVPEIERIERLIAIPSPQQAELLQRRAELRFTLQKYHEFLNYTNGQLELLRERLYTSYAINYIHDKYPGEYDVD